MRSLTKKHTLHHPALSSRFRLERWHRYCLYGTFSLLVVSGMLWIAAHYFMQVPSEFGDTVHPLEIWSIKLHGAAAMTTLFFVGSVWNQHVRRAISARRNLIAGWSLIVILAVLTASGYGLYYLVGEEHRHFWSLVHWIIGLALPVALVVHISAGRKTQRSGTRVV